jgi:aminoglycoside phosphotransferase (APT) family kinase protein
VGADGRLLSLGGAGEFFVLTTYAPGTLYVDDLREIARAGRITGRDEARCTALSRYLVALHAQRPEGGAAAYHRAIRDLLGHGEGIFGMVDSYPEDSPGVTPQRLQRLERKCLEWRWRLRPRVERLRRTHGDFHPFNILFDGDHLTLVDASRGCQGDPADDVTALAINYVFFGLESPGAWKGGLGALWRRFWRTYLEGSGDTGVLEVLAPYLAWRGLVVCNPRFYPGMKAESRDALLGWVERALDAPRFDPRSAEGLCP